MDKDWVKIYSDTKPYVLEILQGLLKDKEINSIIINQKDSMYLFGSLELYVKTEDAFEASQIIKNNQQNFSEPEQE